jgi:hypothetical protein
MVTVTVIFKTVKLERRVRFATIPASTGGVPGDAGVVDQVGEIPFARPSNAGGFFHRDPIVRKYLLVMGAGSFQYKDPKPPVPPNFYIWRVSWAKSYGLSQSLSSNARVSLGRRARYTTAYSRRRRAPPASHSRPRRKISLGSPAHGTFRTCRDVRLESAFEDPMQTCPSLRLHVVLHSVPDPNGLCPTFMRSLLSPAPAIVTFWRSSWACRE